MSESHEMMFSSLAILMAKHQDLGLDDKQMFTLLNIEAHLPAVMAEVVKDPLIVQPADVPKLLAMKIRPSLEASDTEVGANGEILSRLIAFFEKILPLLIPLFVKKSQ